MKYRYSVFSLFLLFILAGTNPARAQMHCAFDTLQYLQQKTDSAGFEAARNAHIQRLNKYRQTRPTKEIFKSGQLPQGMQSNGLSTGCAKTRFVIPVVFHIDETHGGMTVTNGQVSQQMAILNQAYAPYNIQFCLAAVTPGGYPINGIMRITTGFSDLELSNQVQSLTNLLYLDPSKYLNIYVVEDILSNGVSSGIAGYCNILPGMQGLDAVVIGQKYLGDYNNCTGCGTLLNISHGKVLVHEIGHYLGLLHPFRGGCAAGTTTGTCAFEGDFCCDTRPCAAPSYNCPFNSSYNACAYPADPTRSENQSNYMQYTPEPCMDNFTPNQVEIMYSTLETARNGLVHPNNINRLASSCCVTSAWLEGDKKFGCLNDTFIFRTYEYTSAVSYTWEVIDRLTQNVVYSITHAQDTFYWEGDIPGEYDIRLTIEYGLNHDIIILTREAYLQVTDCGDPLLSDQGNWIFGNHAGLSFRTTGAIWDRNPYLDYPNNINAAEGNVSISDLGGNLLFYGGTKLDFSSPDLQFFLFNGQYDPMPGKRVIGDPSAAQGGVVVPVPGSFDRYYLLCPIGSGDAESHAPDSLGLRYSIIDMSLNAGLGGVDPLNANVPVMPPSGSSSNAFDGALHCEEIITAIPKCGYDDYWIITSENSGAGSYYQKLLVYSLTSSGISFHGASPFTISDGTGQLKASPDGSFLVLGDRLMKFDRSTGNISAYVTLPNTAWGSSFSPNSKVLYAIEPSGNLIQYDLESGAADFSAFSLGKSGTTSNDQFQLGPDGKIYISNEGKGRLAVINNPDAICNDRATNKCNYTVNGPSIQQTGKGGILTTGLPNMVDAKKEFEVQLDFRAIITSCNTVTFQPNSTCGLSYLWDFGDGNTSNLAEVQHTYLSEGTYEVTLLMNGFQQFSREIKIGIEEPEFGGNIYVCDPGKIQLYSLTKPQGGYTYSWLVSNGDMMQIPGDNASVQVKWNGNGSISCTAYNPKTGCYKVYSENVVMSPLTTNTIGSDQTLCPSDLAAPITGNTVTGGDGTTSYQWQQLVGGVWEDIPGATGIDYTPPTPTGATLQFRRAASSSFCNNFSNTVSIYPSIRNFDISADPIDFVGCAYVVMGELPVTNPGGGSYTYQWYTSPDNITFTPVSLWGTSKDYASTLDVELLYIYREVTYGSCVVRSNTLTLKPRVRVIRQAQAYTTCDNHVYFDIVIDNPENLPVKTVWFMDDIVNGSFSYLVSGHFYDVYGQTLDYYQTHPNQYKRFFKPSLQTYDCAVWLDPAEYINNPPMAIISTQPQSQTITDLTGSVNLSVAASGPPVITYEWQKSVDSGPFIVVGTNSPTLFDDGLDACHTYDYRVLLYNGITNCLPVVSDVAHITVDRSGDVWMQDYFNDNGSEPNTTSSWTDIWLSHDIWVRWTTDGLTDNTDKGFRYQIVGAAPDPNYVYYNVRNLSTTESTKPAELYLYWSVGSFRDQLWPTAWTYNSGNVFVNAGPGPCTGTHPLGGQINLSPITVPSLSPGQVYTNYFQWNDVPNAGCYYVTENGVRKNFANDMPVCMLARITHCDDDPYGMTTPEVAKLRWNVLENNNIVARNTKAISLGPTSVKRSGGWFPVGDDDDAISLTMSSPPCLVGTYLTVDLHMDDVLWNAWALGGYSGSGFTILSSNIIRVTNLSSLVLNNITLGSGVLGHVLVDYELSTIPTFNANCVFTLAQHSGSESNTPEGAFTCYLDITGDPYGTVERSIKQGLEHSTDPDLLVLSSDEQVLNVDEKNQVNIVQAFPNPFQETLNFSIRLVQDAEVGIELYNSLGMLVATVDQQHTPAGVSSRQLNTSQLAAGVYTCKVTVNDEVKNVKLVLNK